MLKSKRKLIITLSVVGAIVLLIILSSALFSLRTVTVDYITLNSDIEHSVLKTYDKNEIIQTGKFAYNKNILFVKYDGAKERIEKAFPFAKVVGFTRHFPSSVVVQLAEREAVAKIYRTDGKWVVIDDELKVLIVSSVLDSYYSGLPTLDSGAVATNGATEGSFLSSGYLAHTLHNLKRGITNSTVNLNMKSISSISITTGSKLEDYVLNLTLQEGASPSCKVVINGINNLARKSLDVFTTFIDVRNNSVEYPDRSKVTITVDADYTGGDGNSVRVIKDEP